MRHVPHLLLIPPWDGEVVPLDPAAARHLTKVMRLGAEAVVTYTDGAGTVGEGALDGAVAAVVRGAERPVAPPVPRITLAVAPPNESARARYVVEKAAELGVAEVRWVHTAATQGKPPRPERAQAWAVAALQQSRGAHLTAIGAPVAVAELGLATVVTDAGGGATDPAWWEGGAVTLLIGPEGGLRADEVAGLTRRMGLGSLVLRTETAAVVAASLVLDTARRHGG